MLKLLVPSVLQHADIISNLHSARHQGGLFEVIKDYVWALQFPMMSWELYAGSVVSLMTTTIPFCYNLAPGSGSGSKHM